MPAAHRDGEPRAPCPTVLSSLRARCSAVTHPGADLLADLARQLASEDDRAGVLARVVAASLTQIDGAEHAGITELTRNGVTTPVATDDLVHQIDQQQYTIGEGPCLSAALEGQHTVCVDDLRTDTRWPQFSAAVTSLGVRSMLSFQLYTGAETSSGPVRRGSGASGGSNRIEVIGALNIYAGSAAAFTDESVHNGTLLAAHAAVAAAAADTTNNLRIALQSRDMIGQAKGILMERFKLTPEQAFDLLITASQNTNRKLRDLAEHLSATGELPV